jgi:hypothetical protein
MIGHTFLSEGKISKMQVGCRITLIPENGEYIEENYGIKISDSEKLFCSLLNI